MSRTPPWGDLVVANAGLAKAAQVMGDADLTHPPLADALAVTLESYRTNPTKDMS